MNKFKLTLLALLTALSNTVCAIELTDNSELHGFVSQGLVYSPDNAYAGSDLNGVSLDFREIGLNGAWDISEQFRITGQVLSRKTGESDNGDLRVDFLLMDYLAHSTANSNFGVRLGRVKNAMGLYNSTRDIPIARPGLSVPSSIYFDSLRDSILSTDGLNLYGSYFAEFGTLNWEASAGTTSLKSTVLENYLFGTTLKQGEFDKALLSSFKVDFLPNKVPGLLLGASFLKARFDLQNTQTAQQAGEAAGAVAAGQVAAMGKDPSDPINAELLANLTLQEIGQNYTDYLTKTELDALIAVLYAQYAYKDWIFSAEYMNIFSDVTSGVAGMVTKNSTTSEGFYLQSEWFFRDNMSALLRYEELYIDSDDKDGSEKPLRPMNEYFAYGKGLTFGLSWDFQENWRLVGQVGLNQGTVWLPYYDGIENTQLKRDWNTYMLQLSYQF